MGLALDILCHDVGCRYHVIVFLSLAECRFDDNGMARLLHLLLLTDRLLCFAMIVYQCVPGMFICISMVGMFYLQYVTQLPPAAAGALCYLDRSLHLSPL